MMLKRALKIGVRVTKFVTKLRGTLLLLMYLCTTRYKLVQQGSFFSSKVNATFNLVLVETSIDCIIMFRLPPRAETGAECGERGSPPQRSERGGQGEVPGGPQGVRLGV